MIFEGLIFFGWQLRKDFHDFVLRFTPMEYFLMKAKFKDESFTDSQVTAKSTKFMPIEKIAAYTIILPARVITPLARYG